MHARPCLLVGAVGLSTLAPVAPSHAQSVRTLVPPDAIDPVSGEAFLDVMDLPNRIAMMAWDGHTAVFAARTDTTNGLYTSDGNTITRVLASGLELPGQPGNPIERFGGVTRNGARFAFSLDGSLAFTGAIVQNVGGVNSVVLDNTTIAPDGMGALTFSGGSLDIDDDNTFVWNGGTQQGGGILTNAFGDIQPVATGATPVPDFAGASFASLSTRPIIDGGLVAFRAGSFRGSDVQFRTGIYSWDEGLLRRVADSTTAAPDGGTHVFSSFLRPGVDVDAGVVYFASRTSQISSTGLYASLASGTPLEPIVDRFTLIPGSDETFAASPSHNVREAFDAEGGIVAFSTGFGVYVNIDGETMKVIDRNDAIDPTRSAQQFSISPEAIGGRTLAIRVLFDDSSEGLYAATIPGLCAGDCDASGAVDFNDLVCTLFDFGNQGGASDCDESGAVDFNDLVCALFAFGSCDA